MAPMKEVSEVSSRITPVGQWRVEGKGTEEVYFYVRGYRYPVSIL